MTFREAIQVLKENTLSCWWPSKAMGKNYTDFDGIFGEIQHTLLDIKRRQDIPDDAKFFVLDENNSETKLYNEIMTAVCIVKQAMQNTYPA
jgi:hypothetical protein